MLYISIILIPFILCAFIVVLLPEVTKKNGIVKIGTIVNEKYDLNTYDLVIKLEQLRGTKFRGRWYVSIYVYDKNDSDKFIRTHIIPANGTEMSAQSKKVKIEKIIKSES